MKMPRMGFSERREIVQCNPLVRQEIRSAHRLVQTPITDNNIN